MTWNTAHRVLGLVAGVVFGLAGALGAQNALSATSVGVSAGALPTAVTVTVNLNVGTNLSHLGFRANYDPALLSVTAADIAPVTAHFAAGGASKVIVSVDSAVGQIVWTASDYAGAAVINSGNGALATIQFTALAPLGYQTATVDVHTVSAWNTVLNAVTITPQDGAVKGLVPVTVSSSAPSPTAASPIPFTISFAAGVTGFAVGDLAVSNGTPQDFVQVSASEYAVNIVPGGDGSVTLGVPAGAAQHVTTGNDNAAATPLTRTYDGSAPTVALSTTAAEPTNQKPFTVTVTFSEDVSGFALADLSVSNGTAGSLAGGPRIYTVAITPTADGVVNIDLPAGRAQDAAGNGNSAAARLTRTYDAGAPAVVVTSSVGANTPESVIPFTIVFTEVVTGFAEADIEITNGTLLDFVETVTGLEFTLNIEATAEGDVVVAVPAGVAVDRALNGNAAGSGRVAFAPNLDVDRDGLTNFRDVVFCSRYLNGHPTVADGVTLPSGETQATVEARIEMVLRVGSSGFAPLDVDMDGAANIRDIIFTYRRMFGYSTVAEGVTLPSGVTEDDVNVLIDALML